MSVYMFKDWLMAAKDYLMAIGTSHNFTVIIFAEECCRCKPSRGKNTKAVLRRLSKMGCIKINENTEVAKR